MSLSFTSMYDYNINIHTSRERALTSNKLACVIISVSPYLIYRLANEHIYLRPEIHVRPSPALVREMRTSVENTTDEIIPD